MEPAAGALPVGSTCALDISLLGTFAVRGGASLLRLPVRKAQALLAYLALRPGKAHEREKLSALLWSEAGKAQAQASLRQLLFTLRAAVMPYGSALRAIGGAVALDASQVAVDVLTLERCVAEGTREALEGVPAVCGGLFLDGFVLDEPAFDEWVIHERTRLRELSIGALEKLAELQAEAGNVDRAIQTALQALRMEPRQERTHRSLMRLYTKHGRRAEAVHQYESCAATLGRDLGVEPEEQTKQLYCDIRSERSSGALRPQPLSLVVPKPPIVGRDAELHWLELAVEAAWAGSRPMVLLRGDAGVGKTRLVQTMEARVSQRGGKSLRGRSFASEQVLPFAVWIDLLRSEPARTEGALATLPPALRAEVSRILPMPTQSAGDVRPAMDTRMLFEALRQLLDRIAGQAPLLLVLEDLHWADAMSLRLVSFLARHVGGTPQVCLLATLRDEEENEPALLQTVLQEVDREQRLHEKRVEPLSRQDTLALVRSLAPGLPQLASPAALERIWRMSEGNPLVVVEAVHGHEQGALAPDVAAMPIPLRVRGLIASYVARLDRFSQDALAAAAVIGREFDFKLLSHVLDANDRVLATTIENLVHKRLLQASRDGFYFSHDRVREVVLESLLPPRLCLLHGSIARALEKLGADRLDEVAGALGYHFAGAGEAAASVGYLLRFAERAMRNWGLEEALAALGEVKRQSAMLPVADRDAVLIKAVTLQASCLLSLGRIAEMEPALAPYRALVEKLNDPALTVLFHSASAFVRSATGDRSGTDEYGRLLLAVADQSPSEHAAGVALSQLSQDAYRTGRFQKGAALAREAVAKFDAVRAPMERANALIFVAANSFVAGDWRPSLDALRDAIQAAETAGSLELQTIALAALGVFQSVIGDCGAGLAACHKAIAVAPNPYSASHAHGMFVRAASFVMIMGRVPHPPSVDDAFASLLLDDSLQASMAVLKATDAAQRDRSSHDFLSRCTLIALAEGELALQNQREAHACALRAVEACPPDGDPLQYCEALSILARTEWWQLGPVDASRRRVEMVLEQYGSLGAALPLALTLLDLAGITGMQGHSVTSAGYLGQAYRRFDELGLPFWVQFIAGIAGSRADDC